VVLQELSSECIGCAREGQEGIRQARDDQAPRDGSRNPGGDQIETVKYPHMSEPSTGVPLLDLQAQYRPLRAEILAAIERVCDSQRFIMGPEITALEAEMAAMLGARHAVAVSSGTDALLLALMALDIRAGDEVITPTYSFFA